MKTSSAKKKGKRLELKVAQELRKAGFQAGRMPLSGADSMLKGDIYCPALPDYHFECKNQERVKLWEWWQIVRDTTGPVLVISGNHRPIVAVIELEKLIDLIKCEQKLEELYYKHPELTE